MWTDTQMDQILSGARAWLCVRIGSSPATKTATVAAVDWDGVDAKLPDSEPEVPVRSR